MAWREVSKEDESLKGKEKGVTITMGLVRGKRPKRPIFFRIHPED